MIVSSVSVVDIVTFFVAVFLPLLNGFLSSRNWSPAAKGIALAVLALVASVANEFLNALVDETSFDIGQSLLKWGGIFVVAVASYFGILSRPLSKNSTVQLAGGNPDDTVPVTADESIANVGSQGVVSVVAAPKSIASIVSSKGVK